MTKPVLSVVVLAWDQLELTRQCVDSIRRTTDVPYELIIVDNGSGTDAATYAESAADVAVLNEENRGFATGMNQGLAVASGEFVAFVNNDTELPERWASRLMETFADHPTAGLVLPAVTAAGNQYSVRTEPGTDRIVVPPFRAIPSGVLYVLPAPLLDVIGGWCEDYPVASSEDLDLLFTVWGVGHDVVLDERVLVEHVGSGTVTEKLPERNRIWRENRRRFTKKWMAIGVDDLPAVPGIDPTVVNHRAQQAATAATWMERWFVEKESTAALRAQLGKARRQEEAASARITVLERRAQSWGPRVARVVSRWLGRLRR